MIVYREVREMKLSLVCILLICLGSKSYAQNEIGLIPQINSDFKIGESWKVNSKFEGRQIFFKNPYPAGQNQKEFDRFDIELVATKSLDPLRAFGGGYLIRRADNSFTHRFIQQYALTRKLLTSRLSHRFRTDQTIEKDESLQWRLRYRLSWEKPLNGFEIDPGEFYLKLNNEYLGILQDSKGNLEIRGLASVGYDISDKNKIETGIDYRVENLIRSETKHLLFLSIGLYHSF